MAPLNSRRLSRIAVVCVAGLLGLSLAKVFAGDPWAFALGGAAIALVALGVAAIFAGQTASLEKTTPARKLLGPRIAVVGFMLALFGWLVGVFVSATAGYYVVALGAVLGLVGLSVHAYHLVRA